MSYTVKKGIKGGVSLEAIDAHWRAANYLGAAQLYLQKNALLRRPLEAGDIKPRLLGHWGTVPGINLVYSHLNRLIMENNQSTLLVTGPGHGAPGILANLFLEGSLTECEHGVTWDAEGIEHLARVFSWPYGHPSHLVPSTPGQIQEGGELGYSLSHAFGAALDNPELLVVALVGDGEAETGPLAAAWHSNKFFNPATSGAVLPILDVNGYKLSGPSIFGRMSDEELDHLFRGYGYFPAFVKGDDPMTVHEVIWKTLDWAYGEIKKIQAEAREGFVPERVQWPMIILQTPKGWTCPKAVDGKPVENTFHSHQIPVSDPANNPEHLKILEQWLRSYRPEELFDGEGAPAADVNAVCPEGDLRMGRNPHANGGQLLKPLNLPDFTQYAIEVEKPSVTHAMGTKNLAHFVRDIFKENENEANFRFFCPDETTSNRMNALFEASERAWLWPKRETDEFLSKEGRVMEILSEHTCQGWLEGYLLTGRHGMFACYEAFIPIVDSMLNQYAKWLVIAKETAWRKPIASLNYLLTSHVWRQDHNGFTHQVPSFINNVINKRASVARVYLPPDGNCLLSVTNHCLKSYDYVNLIVASKQNIPQWLTMEQAKEHCARGMSRWEFASNDEGNPDVILCAAGDVPTTEVVAAAHLLRKEIPELKVRVVNVVDLLTLMSHHDHPHGFDDEAFAELFGYECPVIFAFHGYPRLIHELVYHRPNPLRFHVHGYQEKGTTTTPFDMLVMNQMSRYDLVIAALHRVHRLEAEKNFVINQCERKLAEHRDYIREHDVDMPEVVNWVWE